MTKLTYVMEGLQILARYYSDIGVYGQHDIIVTDAKPARAVLSAEDVAKLEELGWFISVEYNCWAKFT